MNQTSPTPTPIQARCEAATGRLVEFFETLAPESLSRLAEFYTADARFKDPFNEVVGVAAIARVFEHMFATVEAPRFRITRSIVQGDQAMLGWDFELIFAGRRVVVHGVSHLVFDEEGRVALHRDYWDAAGELYEKLPVLGTLMQRLRRRFAPP